MIDFGSMSDKLLTDPLVQELITLSGKIPVWYSDDWMKLPIMNLSMLVTRTRVYCTRLAQAKKRYTE